MFCSSSEATAQSVGDTCAPGDQDAGEIPYMTIAHAKAILAGRQRTVRDAVKRRWKEIGCDFPPRVPDKVNLPLSFLSRPVASARQEEHVHYDESLRTGTYPFTLEYTATSVRRDSRSKSIFSRTIVWSSGEVTREDLADYNANVGKPWRRVACDEHGDYSGVLVIQKLRNERRLSGLEHGDFGSTADLYEWITYETKTPVERMARFLSMCLALGIWRERFPATAERGTMSRAFVSNVVLPACQILEEQFGALPLICEELSPWKSELANFRGARRHPRPYEQFVD